MELPELQAFLFSDGVRIRLGDFGDTWPCCSVNHKITIKRPIKSLNLTTGAPIVDGKM